MGVNDVKPVDQVQRDRNEFTEKFMEENKPNGLTAVDMFFSWWCSNRCGDSCICDLSMDYARGKAEERKELGGVEDEPEEE